MTHPIINATNNPEAWHEARRPVITATRVAAICGIHPWETPRTVYLAMTGAIADKEQTEAMEIGTALEPFIAAMFAKRHGIEYGKDMIPCGFALHPKNPRHGATPDFEFAPHVVITDSVGREWKGSEGGAECKFAGPNTSRNFGAEDTDEVAMHYIAQCQWQCYVKGWKWVVLVLFTSFGKVKTYFIPADAEMIRRMVFRANLFLGEYIDAAVPPPISGQEPDTDLLNKKWEADDGKIVAAPYELEESITELREVIETVKCGELIEAELKNRVREHMADAATLESLEGKFTWKPNKASVDTDYETCFNGLRSYASLMLADQPELADLFTKEAVRLVDAATVTKPGPRVLRTPWRSERT